MFAPVVLTIPTPVPAFFHTEVQQHPVWQRQQDVLRQQIMVAELVTSQNRPSVIAEIRSLDSATPGTHSVIIRTSGGGGGGPPGALNQGGAGGHGNATCFCPPDAVLVSVTRPPCPNAAKTVGETGGPQGNGAYRRSFDLHMKREKLSPQCKQGKSIPDNKKDESSLDRRRRNNEAAKRSREKRRYTDMILEMRIVELTKQNHKLKAQLAAFEDKYGMSGESLLNTDRVMATLPSTKEVLRSIKRRKLTIGGSHNSLPCPPNPTSIPTPVIQKPVSAGWAASPPPAPHFSVQKHPLPQPL